VRTPRDEDRTAANLDAIADARGTSPEALRRSMHGDLDTILLKALRTEPDQRYDSALSLAEDVRRHLNGLPIAARPPSVPYRFRKFVFRNRWFTPVAALVLLGLLGFAYTRYRHDRQLERERNEARTQAERAEQLKEFMVGLFGSADPYAPADPARGRAITVVEALAVGAERARVELADRPVVRADLLSSIASVYENLDQREPALDLIDEVLEIRRQHEPEPTAAFALELGKQANLFALTGQPDSAEAAFRRRLELERDLHGPDHPRVADALIGHSNHLFNRGQHQTALGHREQALQILRAAQPALRKELGDVLALLADSYREVQRPADAERAAREALDILRDHLGEQHPSTAIARVHVAQVAHALGDIDTAIRLYREALPVLERTLGPEHYNTLGSWNNLGIVYMDAEDYAGAEQVQRRMLEVRRRMSDGEDDHAVASSLQNLAVTLVRQTRFAEAESLSLRARDIYTHTTPEGHYLRAFPLLTIAEIRLLQRDGIEAERAARAAVRILRAALPAAHYATAAAECRLGAALALRGRIDDAKPLVAAALDVLQNNRQAPDRLVRECMATQQTLERGSSG
jgi:serine/threonine-protein kinase